VVRRFIGCIFRGGALAITVLLAACASRPPVSNQALEDAYVDRRPAKPLCRADDAECCAEGVKAARAASAAGESQSAARLWHEVAVTCPTRRSEVAAALQAPARSPDAGQALNVTYRFSLPPSVRLYWVEASTGKRLLPAGLPTGGDDRVHVEVHAIRFDGRQPGPLMRMDLVMEPPREPGASVTIDVSETPEKKFALVPRVQIEKPAPAVPRPSAPVAPGPGPDLEKARVMRLDTPRLPTELGTALKGTRRAVRACLNREGWVDTIRFLEPTHPRLAASLADALRDARWEPYRVNDRAVPSCEVVELQF
jgi:hypothetical protein